MTKRSIGSRTTSPARRSSGYLLAYPTLAVMPELLVLPSTVGATVRAAV